MRQFCFRCTAIAVCAVFVVSSARASFLPITKPGFSPMNVTNTFTFESVTYNSGDNLPAHLITTGFGNNQALLDSHSLVDTTGTAKINGYGISNNGLGGVIRDARDFTAGNGPTGPAGYLSIDGTNVTASSIDQTLTGTVFQPFTQYTLTVTVFDRQFGAGDQFSFPGKVTLFLTAAGTNLTGGVQTLVNPAAGGNSNGSLVFTTGAVAPTGDLGFRFRINQFTAGAGIVASQAVFDDVAIDAVSVAPEPACLALLGFGGILASRRRRQSE